MSSATPAETSDTVTAAGLRRSLRSRHVTMISIGGIIGAGLFVIANGTFIR